MAMTTQPTVNVIDEIVIQNSLRDGRTLGRKYLLMATSSFSFFRATAHLFYAHARILGLPPSPVSWICGDLHVENFGAYKGNNRVEYFDINDFDEACFGPLSADIVRLAASIMLACEEMPLDVPSQDKLALQALEAYKAALMQGKAYWCEHKTSVGAIKSLFEQIKSRKRVDFLNARSIVKRRLRTISLDGQRYLPCGPLDEKPAAFAKIFAKFAEPEPRYYEFRDVAFRVAGLGSLGLRRYMILLRGKGDPDKNQILDAKAGNPSSAATLLPKRQPKWATEAERVVALQHRLQAVPAAGLTAIRISRHDYVLRELQPAEDRLKLSGLVKSASKDHSTLGQVFEHMARMAAWSHLRGAAREGADGPDVMMKFAQKLDAGVFLASARIFKDQCDADFTAFKTAYTANDSRLAATLK